MFEIYYKKTSTELLVSVCKIKGCKIGGWECVNCVHFNGKNSKRQIVRCTINQAKR